MDLLKVKYASFLARYNSTRRRRFAINLRIIGTFATSFLLVGCSIRNDQSEDFAHVSNKPVGPCSHTNTSFNCVTVVKVYDADTIFVNIPGQHPLFGKRIGVRIAGIDTPELRTRNGCEKARAQEARNLVDQWIRQSSRVDIVNVQRDKYFRVLGTVLLDGKSIAPALIGQGLAYPYTGGRKQIVDWCS